MLSLVHVLYAYAEYRIAHAASTQYDFNRAACMQRILIFIRFHVHVSVMSFILSYLMDYYLQLIALVANRCVSFKLHSTLHDVIARRGYLNRYLVSLFTIDGAHKGRKIGYSAILPAPPSKPCNSVGPLFLKMKFRETASLNFHFWVTECDRVSPRRFARRGRAICD